MVRVRVGDGEFGGLLLLVSRECCIAFSTSAVLTVSQLKACKTNETQLLLVVKLG